MNWQELPKEKKQIYLLMGVGGIGLLYVLYSFALMPLVGQMKQMATEVEDLRGKLDAAQRLFAREEALMEDLVQGREAMDLRLQTQIPPVESPLAWVTEQVYGASRQVGVDVESVANVTADPPWAAAGAAKTKPKPGEPAGRRFTTYSVQIALRCSYEEMLQLLTVLEQGNPFITVMMVQVAGLDSQPEKHTVTLLVSWPIPIEPIVIPRRGKPALGGAS
jgi:hypothetical protein